MSLRINGVDQNPVSPLSPSGRLIDPVEAPDVGGAVPHAIGGAQHTSDTLANFNTKLSDADLAAPDSVNAVLAVEAFT